jgi:hypothetical protein
MYFIVTSLQIFTMIEIDAYLQWIIKFFFLNCSF